MDQEIRIKLTVDGKEANTVLQLSNELFEAIVQKANAYKETTTGAGSSAKSLASDTNAMNQVLAQFGSMMSNSDVFLESFKGSMDLIADNLPGLVMGFANAGKEAGSLGTSVGKMLVSSLTGTGGLMLALEGVSLLLRVLPSLFGDTTEGVKETKVCLDDLIESNDNVTETFKNLKREIDNLDFENLSEKYDAVIEKIKESSEKLANPSFWNLLKQQFKSNLLQALAGSSIFLPYMGGDNEEQDKLSNLQTSKNLIEDSGNRIKNFLNHGYTAKELLNLSPKDRDEINRCLKDILETWPENLNKKLLGFGDKLKGTFIEIGEYSRNYVENYQKLLDSLQTHKDKNTSKNKKISEDKNIDENKVNENSKYDDDLSKIKPAQPKLLLSGIPAQFSPLNELTVLRNETGGYENEKQALEDWYNKANDKYKEDLANHKTTTEEKALLDQMYYNKLNGLNDKYLLTTTKILDRLTNQFAVSFGNIYSYAEKNANNEIDIWKKKENKKNEEERKTALAHAKNQKQREKINEEFDKRQEALENQAQTRAKEKLLVWFRLKQLGDISTTTMSTYKAATSALEPPPVGLGPIWGWPLMATVVAGGLANVAMIASQKMPGYKRGGAIVGEDGPEIIAPFQDYASGQSKLITMTMMTLRDEIRSSRAIGSMSASIGNMGNLETAITKLNKKLDEGIDARAYLDDRQAKRIYNRGSAQNRRSKL